MSARVQGWVWDLDLPAQPKLLLLWLANRATDAGVCFPTKRELGARTGLSERMVRYHLAALASDRGEHGQPREPVLHIIERRVDAERNTSNVYVIRVPWADVETVRTELQELKHVPGDAFRGVGAMGCTQGGDHGLHPVGTTGCTQVGDTGCTQNPVPGERHRKNSPLPPSQPHEQQQGVDAIETKTKVHPSQPVQTRGGIEPAQELVHAFYAALSPGGASLTAALQRRELAIAQQLIEVGATAAEAAAYARDCSMTIGRVAPIDLRSFERERLGWLARRRHSETSRRQVIDRTGQPPVWAQASASTAVSAPPPSAAHQLPAPDDRAQPATSSAGLGGGDLRAMLATVLHGARP